MKKIILCGLLSLIFLSTSHAQYRVERTGYEGDFFSLEGALDLFKRSNTLRDFERKINRKDNWVNNLDLNYDGRTDYIRVEHRRQGYFHAIILQALVDRYNVQDVAVIEIEILGRGEAILQIVGDEDLYGERVYVEPIRGYANNRSGYHSNYGNYVNVYYWQPVQYILGRQYRMYTSPYRWSYYPSWWNPWRQCAWSVFRPRIVVYHNYYHIVPRHRLVRVYNFYQPYRAYCPSVLQRTNQVRIKKGKSPVYRSSPKNQADRNPNVNQRSRIYGDSHDQSRSTIYTRKPGENSSLSRKSRDAERGGIKSRSPQINEKPRRSSSRSKVRRQADPSRSKGKRPSVSRKSYEQKQSGSSRSKVKRSSPNRIDRGSSGSRQKASPKVYRPSRNSKARSNNSTRSRTTTRSTTPNRKPSVKSRRTSPGSKSKVKSSSASKSSRSRKSRGN